MKRLNPAVLPLILLSASLLLSGILLFKRLLRQNAIAGIHGTIVPDGNYWTYEKDSTGVPILKSYRADHYTITEIK